jgi:hypothetical protein
MIKFFRKTRQKMLNENKFSKYLIYAIGEIILVVIGILIALQLNNANELSKLNRLVETYEKNLITELKVDLKNTQIMDSLITIQRKIKRNYLIYYKKTDLAIDTLIQKMDSAKTNAVWNYNRATYTVDDIISTGKLSLFSKEKKEAILKLKDVQDYYEKAKTEENQYILASNLEFEHTVDLTSFLGQWYMKDANIEGAKLEDWRYDLKSEQYRLFGNKTLAIIRNCNFQLALIGGIKKQSESLLTILENNGKNK